MAINIKKLNPWNWLRSNELREDTNSGALNRRNQWPGAHFYPNEILSLYEGIDRMFNKVFNNLGLTSFMGEPIISAKDKIFQPKINVDSTDKEYRIRVEIPGVKEEDIKLELNSDGHLAIRGEKKQENTVEDPNFYHVECSYGFFERTLALPDDSNSANISAHFENGVLTIKVARHAAPKTSVKQIAIQGSNHKKLK